MGEVWFARQPGCPVHGRMRYEPAGSRWTCGGFDGEGCGHVVTGEDIEWRSLGEVRDEDWRDPFRVTARGPL